MRQTSKSLTRAYYYAPSTLAFLSHLKPQSVGDYSYGTTKATGPHYVKFMLAHVITHEKATNIRAKCLKASQRIG